MKTQNTELLYTIMCDVVAGALDKIRELKERGGKRGETFYSQQLIYPKTIWHQTAQTLFLQPISERNIWMTHGVMVALLILVQSVKVRILWVNGNCK